VTGIDLPSPVADAAEIAAKVDAWLVQRLWSHKRQGRALLERNLPKELHGESAFKTVSAGLVRLISASKARFINNQYELAPGVRP
jgi:hypothetical protein